FDGLPLFLQMRLVLEKSRNLDEAVTLFQNYNRTTGWNFIIGDGEAKDGRALETDAKYCNVYKPMDAKESEETGHWGMEDAVRRTNHPVGLDQLMRLALAFGSKFGINVETEDDLKALLPVLQTQDSWLRYEWLSKEIERHPGAMDVREAIQILATGPVYCQATLHSFVADPANKAIYVANAGNNPPVTATDRPFTRIDLSEWFK
ncbi:MAG TPA: hypothetical protein ENN29_12035, partial [Candidatus Hydrogenedentes bacterium]|nr:hypothetical protein [Candidatus Hydrogenedentota bacterium]